MNGNIVWYSALRAYGFVRPVDGGGDIAFHVDDATVRRMGTVAPGTAVNFIVRHDGLGMLACHLAPGHIDDSAL